MGKWRNRMVPRLTLFRMGWDYLFRSQKWVCSAHGVRRSMSKSQMGNDMCTLTVFCFSSGIEQLGPTWEKKNAFIFWCTGVSFVSFYYLRRTIYRRRLLLFYFLSGMSIYPCFVSCHNYIRTQHFYQTIFTPINIAFILGFKRYPAVYKSSKYNTCVLATRALL